MQVKTILMFDSRADFHQWLVNSDLAINENELKTNEKKKGTLILPLRSITNYVDFVNYFQCDSIQSLAFMGAVEDKEENNCNIMPIHISSDPLKLIANKNNECDEN